MTTPTHILTSATLGVTYSQCFNLPLEITVPIAIITSAIVDVNVLWKPIKDHHKDFSHYPIFWLIFSVIISLFTLHLGVLIFLSSLLHLVLDTFGLTIGVHWFAPWSNKEYSFIPLDKTLTNVDSKEKRIVYFTSKYWIYEIFVFITCLLFLFLLV